MKEIDEFIIQSDFKAAKNLINTIQNDQKYKEKYAGNYLARLAFILLKEGDK